MSRLAEALLQSGLITPQQLSIAEADKRTSSKSLLQSIIDLGYVKEELLYKILADVSNLELVSLNNDTIDSSVISLLPQDIAKQYCVFPVKRISGILLLAMSEPADIITIDNLSFITSQRIRPVLSLKSKIVFLKDVPAGRKISYGGTYTTKFSFPVSCFL